MEGSTTPKPDSTPAEKKSKRKKEAGSVKETIESILIAFILAFVFRAFVVEAFVIPTGSMATTLMGAHMNFTCTDCGYTWRVNYSAGGEDMAVPSHAPPATYTNRRQVGPQSYYLVCENCGARVPRELAGEAADNDATSPPLDYGDRILVLKYLYQFSDPKRWDVVVFKSPYAPREYNYTQNYIKRLIGLPGEQIMILDGDIYVGEKGAKREDFKIQTKPRHAQEVMWRIVYNNDFQPASAGKPRYVNYGEGRLPDEDATWTQPWVQQNGGSGWTVGSGAVGDHAIHFDNLTGTGKLAFQPASELRNFPLTNWLGYNITMQQMGDGFFHPRPPGPLGFMTYVSDLKLHLFYHRLAGDGPLRLEMTKNDDAFIAEFTPGKVRLLHQADGVETELSQAAWDAPSRPAEVEFTNVDYRVALRVDGEELLATTREQYFPKVAKLLSDHETRTAAQIARVSITGSRQQATLQHVSLWRDVYYTNRPDGGGIAWGSPEHPMQLNDDEYFTLGDNSSSSLDARFWMEPISLPFEELNVAEGRVPGRFMLGKAFFVYWPSGLKLFGKWGLVPNVGEMRFIH